MQKSIVTLTVTCAAAVLFTIFGNFTVSHTFGTTFPSTPLDNIQSSVNSNQSGNSAVEKLAQALQQDKDDGEENGGENWDKAIESLSAEMGIPVDDDIEDALLEITEIHLDNISNN
jgi:hypothetical protein